MGSWEGGKVGRWGGGETYRPSDDAGCRGAFAPKKSLGDVVSAIFAQRDSNSNKYRMWIVCSSMLEQQKSTQLLIVKSHEISLTDVGRGKI